MSGKVYLITGGYSGLGAASADALLSAGAHVVIAGRSASSQADFVKKLVASGADPGRIDGSRTLDLGSLASVRDFAAHIDANYERIDCLMNNAGVMNTPPGTRTSGRARRRSAP